MSEGCFVAENSFYVRYAETDAMGIVHHASYIVYFEEGRSHYARERGMDYAEFEKTGYWLTVSEVQARYMAPARYGDFITVRCWVESSRSRSLVFGYEVVNKATGTVHVRGESKHICVTHDGVVAKLPEPWRHLAD